jgi:hypothetical protein
MGTTLLGFIVVGTVFGCEPCVFGWIRSPFSRFEFDCQMCSTALIRDIIGLPFTLIAAA